MEYKNTSFKYICVSCIIVLILVLMEYKNTGLFMDIEGSKYVLILVLMEYKNTHPCALGK